MIHNKPSTNIKVQIDDTFSCVGYEKCPVGYKKCSSTNCKAHELAAVGHDTWADFDLNKHLVDLLFLRHTKKPYNKKLLKLIEDSL